MKKYLAMLLALVMALSLVACGQTEEPAEDGTETDTPVVETVKPLDNSADLQNCTAQVAFTAEDLEVTEDGMNLTVEVFDNVLYDAVEVSQLAEGMTIVDGEGNEITVETVEDADGVKNINGGVENGGLTLVAAEGGTYRLATATEYNAMVSLGKQTYAISPECTIVDSADIDNPETTVALADFEALLNGEMNNFNQFNTVITVEDGVITNITRNYMP